MCMTGERWPVAISSEEHKIFDYFSLCIDFYSTQTEWTNKLISFLSVSIAGTLHSDTYNL